jgi:hypothetical protein
MMASATVTQEEIGRIVRVTTKQRAFHTECGGEWKYSGHIDYGFPSGAALKCWHTCDKCSAVEALPDVYPKCVVSSATVPVETLIQPRAYPGEAVHPVMNEQTKSTPNPGQEG